jgi:hypothetical protein
MSEILSLFGWPMTELQLLALVALPAAIAIFAWSAVLIREQRYRSLSKSLVPFEFRSSPFSENLC